MITRVVSSELLPAQSDPQIRERIHDVQLDVVRLASLTTDAVTEGTAAFVDGDLDAADRVVADDDAVDALRHSIEDECLRILARSAELAPADLRFVGVVMRVAHELERSADLMVNVAKTTWRLFPHPLDITARRIIERLGRQAVVQIRVAINAFADRDPSWAAALADMDETIDELQKSLFRHILTLQDVRDPAPAPAPEPEHATRTRTEAHPRPPTIHRSLPRCNSHWSRATTSASAITR